MGVEGPLAEFADLHGINNAMLALKTRKRRSREKPNGSGFKPRMTL